MYKKLLILLTAILFYGCAENELKTEKNDFKKVQEVGNFPAIVIDVHKDFITVVPLNNQFEQSWIIKTECGTYKINDTIR